MGIRKFRGDQRMAIDHCPSLDDGCLSDDVTDDGFDELGPFEPPADYRFEPELRDVTPRSIPAELLSGRKARRQRTIAWSALLAGTLCAISGSLPLVKTWSLFVSPLQYLTWIGLACVALGIVDLLLPLTRDLSYRYVEDGLPLVARICDLALRPTIVIEHSPVYQFVAWIQYRDPQTGQIVGREIGSRLVSEDESKQLTTSYRVGDYVTAVYLRDDPDRTLALYGFLDLKPGLGLVRWDGKAEPGVLKTLLLIVLLFAFLGILCWNVYAYGRYAPLEVTFGQVVAPFVLGAVLLGGGMIGFLGYRQFHSRRQRQRRNAQAIASGEALEWEPEEQGWFGSHGPLMGLVMIAGALGLGGATMLCWCFTLNALADRSPPELRPVRIDELVMTTHHFLFREYTIEYRLLDNPRKHKLLSTPDEMRRFDVDLGIAEMHAGWLGWPWVRTIRPVRPERDG
jgi:hypothetical protein